MFDSKGRIDVPVPSEFQLCTRCERPGGDYRSTVPTPVEADDTRHDAWSAYLRRWKLIYPCRLELKCQRQQVEGGYYLRIAFAYPDERDSRDGVSPLPEAVGLWPPSLLPDDETPRWLRWNLVYHLLHELDENLTLDGQRVFDPHVDAIYYCEKCRLE
jgi:hypothetical protein